MPVVKRNMKRTFSFVTVFLIVAGGIVPARAGVRGQPVPDPALKTKLTTAALWFQREQKNVGRERADYLLLLATTPTSDITSCIAPALRDDAAYQGTIATFEDALDAAKSDDDKRFLRYNIARTHLLRAHLLTDGRTRRAIAEVAARSLEPFDEKNRDPALWELKGDIEAERGNTDNAIAAYRKIGPAGGSAAFSDYKIAEAWQRARRYAEAEAIYKQALQHDAATAMAGGEVYHLIYQGLASLYVERGDYPSALNALSASVKIRRDTEPFTLRTDVARELLRRGYKEEVKAYVSAALKQTPNDPNLNILQKEAGGG